VFVQEPPLLVVASGGGVVVDGLLVEVGSPVVIGVVLVGPAVVVWPVVEVVRIPWSVGRRHRCMIVLQLRVKVLLDKLQHVP
jgi:alpha-beta hydrolase superfamily lysophospholipase